VSRIATVKKADKNQQKQNIKASCGSGFGMIK
jgi:hypothetical protein